MAITADDYIAVTTALGGICFALTRRLPVAERQPLLQDLVAMAHARNTAGDLRGETILLEVVLHQSQFAVRRRRIRPPPERFFAPGDGGVDVFRVARGPRAAQIAVARVAALRGRAAAAGGERDRQRRQDGEKCGCAQAAVHAGHRTKSGGEINRRRSAFPTKKSAPGKPGADAGISSRKRPFYLPNAAWAAANRAIGTRYGEQLT